MDDLDLINSVELVEVMVNSIQNGAENHRLTILCVVDCAINGFIGDQISLSKGDALVFKNRIK